MEIIMDIKKLPILDRPREKARYYGINKLSNMELLALIIGSGSKENNVLMIATNLLVKAHGIENIINLSYKDLMDINGIKDATAFRFLAISELIKRKGLLNEPSSYIDAKSIANRYRYIIGNNIQESLYLIGVNEKGTIIFEKELYVGTNKSMVSSEEEILNILKIERIQFYIIIHNHPSKNINPSDDDMISTNHLLVKGKRNNIILLDHIIVSSTDEYYSFKEDNALL